ncbi:MAG: hypothetical protein BWX84_00805 [Verrucomicrobia bacterium ADurb.Bin118]|nr:MAG: hypothetical protein BWX84_00805 [Verrucomicrobia bacterium ADurb.Bin118]
MPACRTIGQQLKELVANGQVPFCVQRGKTGDLVTSFALVFGVVKCLVGFMVVWTGAFGGRKPRLHSGGLYARCA